MSHCTQRGKRRDKGQKQAGSVCLLALRQRLYGGDGDYLYECLGSC